MYVSCASRRRGALPLGAYFDVFRRISTYSSYPGYAWPSLNALFTRGSHRLRIQPRTRQSGHTDAYLTRLAKLAFIFAAHASLRHRT